MQKLVLALFVVMTFAAAFASPLLGVTTATYTGQMTTTFEDTNGYDDAQDACVAEFGGNAHVCTTHELGLVSQSEGMRALSTHDGVRYIDLSFGRSTTGQPVNDCVGWTSSSATAFSRCLVSRIGGPTLPHDCTCDAQLSFACCQTVTKKPLSKN